MPRASPARAGDILSADDVAATAGAHAPSFTQAGRDAPLFAMIAQCFWLRCLRIRRLIFFCRCAPPENAARTFSRRALIARAAQQLRSRCLFYYPLHGLVSLTSLSMLTSLISIAT